MSTSGAPVYERSGDGMRTRTTVATSGDSCAGMRFACEVQRRVRMALRERGSPLGRLDGVDLRQVPREVAEGASFVAAAPHFTGRGAEVDTGGIASIGGHRLPLDG